jgi:hypothetical protein
MPDQQNQTDDALQARIDAAIKAYIEDLQEPASRVREEKIKHVKGMTAADIADDAKFARIILFAQKNHPKVAQHFLWPTVIEDIQKEFAKPSMQGRLYAIQTELQILQQSLQQQMLRQAMGLPPSPQEAQLAEDMGRLPEVGKPSFVVLKVPPAEGSDEWTAVAVPLEMDKTLNVGLPLEKCDKTTVVTLAKVGADESVSNKFNKISGVKIGECPDTVKITQETAIPFTREDRGGKIVLQWHFSDAATGETSFRAAPPTSLDFDDPSEAEYAPDFDY